MKNKNARLVGVNIKLGNMATFSKLMGCGVYDIEGKTVCGSCGKHCHGCEKACYVKKSYRYKSVILRHGYNTLAFRDDIEKAFDDIDSQMTRKRVPFKFVRINQSGEIETYLELLKWYGLAVKHPETVFYIYTKNYEVLSQLLKSVVEIPNFTINVSIWGCQGVKEYMQFKDNKMVKGFVYIDDTYTLAFYMGLGVIPDTFCNAYKDGKLNHEITCDKCQKCIKQSGFKVIGCNAH